MILNSVRFNNPKSMYVDPRSVQISNTLREKYASNFQAVDQLESQLAALNIADFEGDQKLRKQLLESTRSRLEALAERGDYENLSLPVAQTAQQFRKQYAPLEQNFNKYQEYIKEVNRQYKEGEIDAETYAKAIPASKHSYTGLQVDEFGNIDPKSYFTGMQLVKDVDIFPLVNEAIEGIIPNEYGQQARYLGRGKDGRYAVETSEGVKYVDQNRVAAIYNEVVNRPDVQAALSQKAKLRTYNLDETQANNIIGSDIEMYKGQIADATKLLKNPKLKAQEIASIQQQMDDIQNAVKYLSNLPPDQKHAYLNSREIQGILRPIESAVLAKNVWEQRPAAQNFTKNDYDQIYLKLLDDNLARSRAAEERQGMPVAVKAPGNVTVSQTMTADESISTLTASIAAIQKYEQKAEELNLSDGALRQNKEAQIEQAVNYELEMARFKGAAVEAGIDPSRLNTATWYANLSNSEKSAIDKIYQDEDSQNKYYYKQPVNLNIQTSDGTDFKAFEEELKQALEKRPNMDVLIFGNTDNDDKLGEFAEGKLEDVGEKEIQDIGIVKAPYRNYGGTNNIMVTYKDGTVVMLGADQVSSPMLEQIQNDPVFKLNALTQSVSLNKTYNQNNPYSLVTTFTNDEGQDESVEIRIYPSDDIDDTRYQTVINGQASNISTPKELKTSLQTTALGTIVL